jgi:hypothetical protein
MDIPPEHVRGRPQKYVGAIRFHIISLISTLGLTKTLRLLKSSGVMRKALEREYNVKIDIPENFDINKSYLFKLGREGKIQMSRGRPTTIPSAYY